MNLFRNFLLLGLIFASHLSFASSQKAFRRSHSAFLFKNFSFKKLEILLKNCKKQSRIAEALVQLVQKDIKTFETEAAEKDLEEVSLMFLIAHTKFDFIYRAKELQALGSFCREVFKALEEEELRAELAKEESKALRAEYKDMTEQDLDKARNATRMRVDTGTKKFWIISPPRHSRKTQ